MYLYEMIDTKGAKVRIIYPKLTGVGYYEEHAPTNTSRKLTLQFGNNSLPITLDGSLSGEKVLQKFTKIMRKNLHKHSEYQFDFVKKGQRISLGTTPESYDYVVISDKGVQLGHLTGLGHQPELVIQFKHGEEVEMFYKKNIEPCVKCNVNEMITTCKGE